MGSLLLLAVLIVTSYVSAELRCICNVNQEATVEAFDSTYTSIGHIYPHECVPYIEQSNTDVGWLAVEFKQKIAFIKEDSYTVKERCKQMDDEDGTGSLFDVSTPIIEVEPTATAPGIVTEPEPTMPTTATLPPIIVVNATAAPVPVNSTHGTHGHQCTQPHIGHNLKGDVSKCPHYVVNGAKSFCHVLTQHNHNCYEFSKGNASWTHAQQLCKERGGHLLTIHNKEENTYIHHLLTQMNITRAVWLGLHDQIREGHFQWVTGEHLSYTNWSAHSKHDPDNQQDCAAMMSSGQWEDVHCGAKTAADEHNLPRHMYICEYHTHSFGTPIVG